MGAHFRRPVKVLQGYVCDKSQLGLAGGKRSYHRQGRAAYIQMEGVPVQELFKFVKTLPELRGVGIDLTGGRLHVDTRREDPAEWYEEGGKQIPLTEELKARYGLSG